MEGNAFNIDKLDDNVYDFLIQKGYHLDSGGLFASSYELKRFLTDQASK